ncbi:MAG: major capsid protein [Fusobacterium necrophorum]|nr:major capsid protein [Fusobacterium necrophorum]
MASKIFGLIALTAIMEQSMPPKHFLYDLLVGEEIAEKTVEMEIHSREAGREKAPLVGRRERGVFVKKEAFAMQRVKPSYIKLNTVNEAESIFEQQFGQTPYADPQATGKQILADELKKFKDIAFRTRLWMLIELIRTGTCPMEDGKQGIQFGEINKETLAGVSLFTNAACDPIAYLKRRQTDVQKATGVVIDTVIMSPDVSDAFLANEKVKEYLNTRHANYVRVNDSKPEDLEGKREIAYLPTLGITVYSFVDWYTDMETGKESEVIPAKTCIGLKAKSFAFRYGAMMLRPEQGKSAKLFVKKEVVRKWYPDTSEDEELQYHSAPLCLPRVDVKSWWVDTVI